MDIKLNRWSPVLASALAALVLLESCSGALTKTSAPQSTTVASPEAPHVEDEQRVEAKPKRRLWPWAVGGVATGAVIAGTLVLLAAAAAGAIAAGAVPDFDFGLGFGGSKGNDRRQDDGGSLPVVASR